MLNFCDDGCSSAGDWYEYVVHIIRGGYAKTKGLHVLHIRIYNV